LGLPFAILIGLFFLISDVFSHRIYVGENSVPDFSEAKGVDDKEASKMLNDDIEQIYKKASSMKSKHSDVRQRINPFQINVSGVQSSYNSLVDYIKNKFNIEDNVISGVIFYEGMNFCYRTRINNQLIDSRCFDYSQDSGMIQLKMVDSIIFEQAHGIVGYTDPYILSMYHYKKGEYKKALIEALATLNVEPDARKIALGTISNCYRGLGKFHSAKEYYLKAIHAIPEFYPSQWQYSVLLVEIDDLEKARKLILEVMDKDPTMLKQCLKTGMSIECKQTIKRDLNST
jgi:tetratricopeptide (TPR) repeat protein